MIQKDVAFLTEQGIRAQEVDRCRREMFLDFSPPTQQAIIDVLEGTAPLLRDKLWEVDAQTHLEQEISSHGVDNQFLVDEQGVNWDDVHWYIQRTCFEDSEWNPRRLVGNRVGEVLTISRCLMEDALENSQSEDW